MQNESADAEDERATASELITQRTGHQLPEREAEEAAVIVACTAAADVCNEAAIVGMTGRYRSVHSGAIAVNAATRKMSRGCRVRIASESTYCCSISRRVRAATCMAVFPAGIPA